MKSNKNTFSNHLRLKWYLPYCFVGVLLATATYVKADESTNNSYSPTPTERLHKDGQFIDHEHESYSITIASAPNFIKLKKQDNEPFTIGLDPIFFRYATKKDPLIITLENVQYSYRDIKGKYGQKASFGEIILKIRKADGVQEFSSMNKYSTKDPSTNEDEDSVLNSKSNYISFMEIHGKNKKIGFIKKKYDYSLEFLFNNPELTVDAVYSKPSSKSSKSIKKIKKLNSILQDNKNYIKGTQSPDFHFEISKIEVTFPQKESDQKPVRSIIGALITAVIVSSLVGGVTYQVAKSSDKEETSATTNTTKESEKTISTLFLS